MIGFQTEENIIWNTRDESLFHLLASEQAIKALDVMKEQLCNDNTIDYEKLMDAVGIFFLQAGILSGDRRQFARNQPEE